MSVIATISTWSRTRNGGYDKYGTWTKTRGCKIIIKPKNKNEKVGKYLGRVVGTVLGTVLGTSDGAYDGVAEVGDALGAILGDEDIK